MHYPTKWFMNQEKLVRLFQNEQMNSNWELVLIGTRVDSFSQLIANPHIMYLFSIQAFICICLLVYNNQELHFLAVLL